MAGTLAGWRAYALARGDNAPTAASDTDAAAALLRAQDYIAYHYLNDLDDDFEAEHDFVEFATYIAASLELTTTGFFSKTYTPAEQKVLTQVGQIKWTVTEGAAGMDKSVSPVSSLIEAMFKPHMTRDGWPLLIGGYVS